MKNEGGSALLLVLIISALLTVLGLGLTFSTLTEFNISHEFESHDKAVLIADAGFGAARSALRGSDLSLMLAQPVAMPLYLDSPVFEVGTFAYRNPIHPRVARNIDFDNPPTTSASAAMLGVLTPPDGQPLGSGRFFARVSDNDDGDGNPAVDSDGTVYLRTVGIHPNAPGDVSAFGSSVKNSVAIIEGLLRRDFSFDVNSPFTLLGPDVNPAQNNFFNGEAFLVDGYDHSGMTLEEIHAGNHDHRGEESDFAAVSAVWNDPSAGDATTPTSTIVDGMEGRQYNNLEGARGSVRPSVSVRDDTELIRTSSNPDAQNIFDAQFLATFTKAIIAAADNYYPGDTTLSGTNILLGTEDSPEITVVDGDLSLSGSGTGSGVLVVTGKLEYSGAFDYNGVILAVGEGSVDFGGANKSIVGGLLVSNLIETPDGQTSFGAPSFTLSGNTNFYFRSASIMMAISLLPLDTIMWREIFPEIEPAEGT